MHSWNFDYEHGRRTYNASAHMRKPGVGERVLVLSRTTVQIPSRSFQGLSKKMMNRSRTEGWPGGSPRSALVRIRHRVEARLQAARDIGSAALITSEQAADGATFASTPYIRIMHAEAERASDDALVRLHRDNQALIVEIRVRAAAVVRARERGRPQHPHHARLQESITKWETAADRAGNELGAVVEGLNKLVNRYWARLIPKQPAFTSSGRADPASAPKPLPIVRNERWSSPRDLFPRQTKPSRLGSTEVLDRAVEIVVFGATA
jgi:hypothetical protein